MLARFLLGIMRKASSDLRVDIVEINGAPGILARTGGAVVGAVVPDIEAGQIRRLRIVVNPDKLRHVQSDVRGRSRSAD